MNRQTQLINFCKPERIFCQVTKNPGRLGMMPVTAVLMGHAHHHQDKNENLTSNCIILKCESTFVTEAGLHHKTQIHCNHIRDDIHTFNKLKLRK